MAHLLQDIYTVVHKKTWQLHLWSKLFKILMKREWIQSASEPFTYLFYMWRKYDITVTFMTLMSWNSVCCMCSKAWSSCWLMTQLTNCQYACILVFMPVVDIMNISCDCQFVFTVLDELYASHHAWYSGLYSKTECIIKVWNVTTQRKRVIWVVNMLFVYM